MTLPKATEFVNGHITVPTKVCLSCLSIPLHPAISHLIITHAPSY